MNEISKEYAKALFMLATEDDSINEYGKALDIIADSFSENPGYFQLIESPAIPVSERLGLLDNAFSGSVPVHVLSFIKLLCEKRHISELFDCVRHYKDLQNEVSKVSEASVISAVELSENERKALKEKLEKMSGHTVIIKYTVDKSILGGLIVEMDGKVMDSSIKKHLKNVKDVISR